MNLPYIISGSSSSSPVVDNAGPDRVIITPTGSLSAPLLLGSDGRWTVTINGAAQAGIILAAGDLVPSTITIGRTAFVQGDVELNSAATVKNSGLILGEMAIKLSTEARHSITNTGLITGSLYSIASTSGASIDTVTNSGILDGSVALGGGNDHLFNRGRIFGGIELGEGDDFLKVSGGGIVNGGILLGAGKDTCFGGAGVEILTGGEGNDKVNLGGGNDFFFANFVSGSNDGNDTINGGAGSDTYDASDTLEGVTINLGKVNLGNGFVKANTATSADIGTDKIFGFENAIGSKGNDFMYGTGVGNVLDGGDGIDFLFGLGGNDTLSGGGGADDLIGGLGRDILYGGGGADEFVFNSIAESGKTVATCDVIMDFTSADGDKIYLHNMDADTKTPNDQDFTSLVTSFTNHARELRAQSMGTDTLVEGDVNGDGKADFAILVKNLTTISINDFRL